MSFQTTESELLNSMTCQEKKEWKKPNIIVLPSRATSKVVNTGEDSIADTRAPS